MQGSKIKVAGNARIVYMPKNIFDFMEFYGVKHSKTKATFYKAVNKYSDGTYHSNYDSANYEHDVALRLKYQTGALVFILRPFFPRFNATPSVVDKQLYLAAYPAFAPIA